MRCVSRFEVFPAYPHAVFAERGPPPCCIHTMSSPTPFPDFEHHDVDVTSRMVGDIKIHTRKYGKGEPLLLIHGYPQTSQ